MAQNTYKVSFTASTTPDEEIVAASVGTTHDGTLSWIVFNDGLGEKLRLRSGEVKRVERIG